MENIKEGGKKRATGVDSATYTQLARHHACRPEHRMLLHHFSLFLGEYSFDVPLTCCTYHSLFRRLNVSSKQ